MRELTKGKTEEYIKWYFEELLEAGIVNKIITEPNPIVISSAVNIAGKTYQELTYTPDIIVSWNDKRWFNTITESDKNKPFIVNLSFGINGTEIPNASLIEVKPDVHWKYARANFSMITFPLKQRMLFDNTLLFVQRVTVKKLFEHTFTPRRYLSKDKQSGLRKINFNVRTLQEFLEQTENLTKRLSKISKDEIYLIDE